MEQAFSQLSNLTNCFNKNLFNHSKFNHSTNTSTVEGNYTKAEIHMRAKLHQHISRYVCKTMNNTTMGKLRIIGYWGKRELHSRKVQEALEWRISIYILRYDALSKCRPCVLRTSQNTSTLNKVVVELGFQVSLPTSFISAFSGISIFFICSPIACSFWMFSVIGTLREFWYWFRNSFKRYGLVFDTFAAELAWVCLPCVCACITCWSFWASPVCKTHDFVPQT